ncbi:beta-ketoacyl synthase N-terminal-like domain-containing protein [Streptomyces stramineus]
MDPEQRLALELGWEALEDAGLAAADFARDSFGVFLSGPSGDYTALRRLQGGPVTTAPEAPSGTTAELVSCFLGAHGARTSVDLAGASALAAVHLGCESLRRGESTLALAGGVEVNLFADRTAECAIGGCPGDDPGGEEFAEGGGVVVLKRLAHALAAEDKVHCLVNGSVLRRNGKMPRIPTSVRLTQARGRADSMAAFLRTALSAESQGVTVPTSSPERDGGVPVTDRISAVQGVSVRGERDTYCHILLSPAP